MLMETPEDLARVRTAMEPRLERLFADNGYVLLNWGDVGWIRFFLPDDDMSPEAAKRRKMLAWSDDALQDLWRQAGFRPVILNLADVLPGLQTGLVDAMGSTPLFVLSNQWFPFVPFMVDMPWSPLVGATLVDRRTWEQIPSEIRPELIRIAREVGAEIQVEIQRLEAEAIEAMKARGLTVVKPTTQEIQAWRNLFESSYPLLRGTVIPADWFDEALRVVREGGGG
jgi:TRAP-type C4-dicarboxylate transport system substrate-binding protein